jgi:hypothetical protein
MAVVIDQPRLSFFINPAGDSAIGSDLQYIRNLDWANSTDGSLHTTTYDVTRDELESRREQSLDEISRACESASNLNMLWPSVLSGISNGDGDISFAALYRAETSIERVKRTGSPTNRISSMSFLLCGKIMNVRTACEIYTDFTTLPLQVLLVPSQLRLHPNSSQISTKNG